MQHPTKAVCFASQHTAKLMIWARRQVRVNRLPGNLGNGTHISGKR